MLQLIPSIQSYSINMHNLPLDQLIVEGKKLWPNCRQVDIPIKGSSVRIARIAIYKKNNGSFSIPSFTHKLIQHKIDTVTQYFIDLREMNKRYHFGEIKRAATGSTYLEFEYMKFRISDHLQKGTTERTSSYVEVLIYADSDIEERISFITAITK